MADDLGYGDLSCYGGEVQTPHLDKLAAAGMRFTDFHSSGNVCSPTRAGLLTGRYQQRAGVPGVINASPETAAHYWGLQPQEITFAELLAPAGYSCGLFGKWHLGYTREYNPLKQGFQRFRGYVSGNVDYQTHLDRMGTPDWWEGLELIEEEGYSTHLITQPAVKFIESQRERPFCLYIAHEAVHAPWQGPQDPPQRGPGGKGEKVSPAQQKRAFGEMLVAMDSGVGQVVAKLDELGLSDNTLVFFFSDNGPAGGSAGPLRGRKGSNWEGGHRVPAIARWPGKIAAGSTTDALSISLDLLPTMCALAGAAIPEERPTDGVNLMPVLTAGKSLPDRQLFWNGKAMREGPWKLMLDGKGAGADSVGLYHLGQDLGEQNNLADKHPDRVKSMQQALAAWREDVQRGATQQPAPPRPANGKRKSK